MLTYIRMPPIFNARNQYITYVAGGRGGDERGGRGRGGRGGGGEDGNSPVSTPSYVDYHTVMLIYPSA